MNKQKLLTAFSPYKILRDIDCSFSGFSGMSGKDPLYPLLLELDLTNACNSFCVFCLDAKFKRENPATLKKEQAFDICEEADLMGVEAISIKGGGEPTMMDYCGELMEYIRNELNIDIGLTTNGSYMDDVLIGTVARCCSWVRFSVDAGTVETHKKIHRPVYEAYGLDTVLKNMRALDSYRKRNNTDLIIGYKVSLCKENKHEIGTMAQVAKENGADYISMRPVDYSCHGIEGQHEKYDVKDATLLDDDDFTVFANGNPRSYCSYKHCWINQFIAVVAADGKMYGCCDLKGKAEFCLGNASTDGLEKVWHSEQAAEVRERLMNLKCRQFCSLKYEKQNDVLNYLSNDDVIHEAFL